MCLFLRLFIPVNSRSELCSALHERPGKKKHRNRTTKKIQHALIFFLQRIRPVSRQSVTQLQNFKVSSFFHTTSIARHQKSFRTMWTSFLLLLLPHVLARAHEPTTVHYRTAVAPQSIQHLLAAEPVTSVHLSPLPSPSAHPNVH